MLSLPPNTDRMPQHSPPPYRILRSGPHTPVVRSVCCLMVCNTVVFFSFRRPLLQSQYWKMKKRRKDGLRIFFSSRWGYVPQLPEQPPLSLSFHTTVMEAV